MSMDAEGTKSTAFDRLPARGAFGGVVEALWSHDAPPSRIDG
jgi:hypothetical protein